MQRVRRRGRRRAQRAAAAPAHARVLVVAPPPPLRAAPRRLARERAPVGAECAALDCEVLYARLKTARHAAVAELHVRWLEAGTRPHTLCVFFGVKFMVPAPRTSDGHARGAVV